VCDGSKQCSAVGTAWVMMMVVVVVVVVIVCDGLQASHDTQSEQSGPQCADPGMRKQKRMGMIWWGGRLASGGKEWVAKSMQ
jgi:hypothetical protein